MSLLPFSASGETDLLLKGVGHPWGVTRHHFCSSDPPGRKALYKSQPQDKNHPFGHVRFHVYSTTRRVMVNVLSDGHSKMGCFCGVGEKKINNKAWWRQSNEGEDGLITLGVRSQLGWKQSTCLSVYSLIPMMPRDLCTQVHLSLRKGSVVSRKHNTDSPYGAPWRTHKGPVLPVRLLFAL